MIELRWLKRDPVPEGEAQCVLQFRVAITGSSYEQDPFQKPLMQFTGEWDMGQFMWGEWQAVQVVVAESVPTLNRPD